MTQPSTATSADALRAARHREALLELANLGTSDLDRESLLERVAELTARALDADRTAVVRVDRDQQATLRAAYGWPEAAIGRSRVSPPDSLVGSTFRRGTAVRVADLRDDGDVSDPVLVRHGFVSAVAAPIPDREGPWGVVTAASTTANAFSADDVELLEVAGAVVGRWLHQDAEHLALNATRHQLEQLVAQVPGTLWTTDRELRFTRSVGAGLAALGLDADEVVGLTVAQYLGPEATVAIEAHERALDGEAGTYEFQTGPTTWHAHVEPLRSATGEVRGVLGVALDVTEQPGGPPQRRDDWFRLLAETSPDIIFRLRTVPSLKVEYVSPALSAVTGTAPERLYARPELVLELVHPQDREAVRALFADPARSREPLDVRLRHRDGHWVWTEHRGAPLEDDDGAIVGLQGTVRDVSAHKATEAALREREEQLNRIVDQLPGVVWVVDGHGHLTESAGAGLDALPDELQDVLQRGGDVEVERALRQLDTSAEMLGAVAAALDGRQVDFETTEFGRWWRTSVRPLRDEDGTITGALGVSLDLTDRHEVEDALRESQERLNRVLETVGDGILVFDRHGVVRFANPAATELFATDRTALEGRRFDDLAWDFRSPSDPEERPFRVVMRTGRPVVGQELTARRADGGLVTWSTNASPLRDTSGRVVGVVASLRDVSEDAAARHALLGALDREREAVERLQRLDEMKNSFLTAVSHELRTPLTGLVGLGELLQRHDEDLTAGRRQQLVARMVANANRLEELLTDLLDLDRLTRGVITAHRVTTELQALLLRTVEAAGVTSHHVNVDVGDITANLDPGRVERIVENLLANAVRHTPPGSSIWVRARRQGDGVLVLVEDTGSGVPDHLKQDVFEAFRMGDSPAARVRGTGVGLTIVQRFAELHGGRAWVEDRAGGGASFRVWLPDGPAEDAADAADHDTG